MEGLDAFVREESPLNKTSMEASAWAGRFVGNIEYEMELWADDEDADITIEDGEFRGDFEEVRDKLVVYTWNLIDGLQ